MKIFIVTAFVLLTVSFTFAATDPAAEKAVVAVVHQFLDGFNKGDAKTAIAACASETLIVDEFPPHQWSGSGACAKWADDFDADAKKNGITDGLVTLGKPRHVDINGDVAYAVFPATYAFKQNGKPMKEMNSSFTAVAQKGADGWHITAWTWTKN